LNHNLDDLDGDGDGDGDGDLHSTFSAATVKFGYTFRF
jgi:hypothetical protein